MKRPGGLGSRGAAFWRSTTGTFDLTDAEGELLAECCRMLDEIDALQEAVTREGVTTRGSAGQTRAHPALAEVRQHRLALGRLLAQLQLPDEEGQSLATPTQARGRNANRGRWGAQMKGRANGAA